MKRGAWYRLMIFLMPSRVMKLLVLIISKADVRGTLGTMTGSYLLPKDVLGSKT